MRKTYTTTQGDMWDLIAKRMGFVGLLSMKKVSDNPHSSAKSFVGNESSSEICVGLRISALTKSFIASLMSSGNSCFISLS
mgnify:CR=1 FL=1